MKLVPFQKSYFQLLITWVKDEDTLLKFAGIGFQFPLTEEQLEKYIEKHPDRLIYLAVDDELKPIAYGEIIPQENNSARLGHLLIGESQNRGKGLGKQLINLLIQEGQEKLKINRMDLFLLAGNELAQNCYLKCGFIFAPNDFSITYKSTSYPILKMTMPL